MGVYINYLRGKFSVILNQNKFPDFSAITKNNTTFTFLQRIANESNFLEIT